MLTIVLTGRAVDEGGQAPHRVGLQAASGSSFGSHTNRWMPPWWVLDDRLEPVPVFERLDVADDVLTLRGSGGTVTADPSNLELR